jgi:hypothetical protein
MSNARRSYREEAESIANLVILVGSGGSHAALVEALEEVFVLIEERGADRGYDRALAYVCERFDAHIEDEHGGEGPYR